MRILVLIGTLLHASNVLALTVDVGGFVDTYYAFDTNRPNGFDRSFTTQAARHNEFNLGLGFIEVKVKSENDVRARIALQAGTSVQVNYAGEPTIGTVSGASLSRHVQEAVIGYQLLPELWVDAGIFLSHIGFESFISGNNWNYTRSLAADFSPYYQAGVKFTYAFNPFLSGQLHIINGWQTISESNPQKSLGTQLSYNPSQELTLIYNTYLGFDAGSRIFHDLITKVVLSDSLQLAAQFDFGQQKPSSKDSYQNWYTLALFARYALTKKVTVAGRLEKFLDSQQSIVATKTPSGLNAWGASFNVDVQPRDKLLWRSEIRWLASKDFLFPGADGYQSDDTVLVSSLSLSF